MSRDAPMDRQALSFIQASTEGAVRFARQKQFRYASVTLTPTRPRGEVDCSGSARHRLERRQL